MNTEPALVTRAARESETPDEGEQAGETDE